MLTLRPYSVLNLTDNRRQRFATDFLPVARHDFPELWVENDDAGVRQILLAQCADAAQHGIDSARGVYLLFSLRVAFGSAFPGGEGDAWAREILGRDGVGEADKLDALETLCWGAPA